MRMNEKTLQNGPHTLISPIHILFIHSLQVPSFPYLLIQIVKPLIYNVRKKYRVTLIQSILLLQAIGIPPQKKFFTYPKFVKISILEYLNSYLFNTQLIKELGRSHCIKTNSLF